MELAIDYMAPGRQPYFPDTRPWGFLCSTEYGISITHEGWKIKIFIALKISDAVFILLINFNIIRQIYFMLIWVKHEKVIIT